MGLSRDGLEQLLGLTNFDLSSTLTQCAPSNIDEQLNRLLLKWLDDVRSLNTAACLSNLRMSLSHVGLRRFVTERIIPFLTMLGCAWKQGELQVFQEHFATRLVKQFLQEQWQLINSSNVGKTIIISTHPLEKHMLGLHLVASILVLEGYNVVMLGNNTPVEEITACAVQTNAFAVAISLSITMDKQDSHHFLQSLQIHLNEQNDKLTTFMVVGGSGATHDENDQWLVHSDLNTMAQAIQNHAAMRL